MNMNVDEMIEMLQGVSFAGHGDVVVLANIGDGHLYPIHVCDEPREHADEEGGETYQLIELFTGP